MLEKCLIAIFSVTLFLSGCSEKKTNYNTAANNPAGKLPIVKNLLVTGIYGYRAGLYEYNFKNKKLSLFWSKENESVVNLSYSKDMKTAFFLTAGDYGKTGAFPFIKDARLYLFNADSNKISMIEKIGSGIQVFMVWGTDNTFKVMLNSLDLTVATYVNQHTQIFNTFGKKLFDEIKTYDITREGYPKPAEVQSGFKSPEGKYYLTVTADSSLYSVYLVFRSIQKKTLLVTTDQKLNQAVWVRGNNYLVFSTLNISAGNKTIYGNSPVTSSLYIYSLKSRRILKQWNGGGLKNFYVLNNFLLFDDGFAENSSINIFNLNTFKSYDSINIKKGCGLKNIPRIPDYN